MDEPSGQQQQVDPAGGDIPSGSKNSLMNGNGNVATTATDQEEVTMEVEAAVKVINAMRYYRHHVSARLRRQVDAVVKMSAEDRQLLHSTFKEHIKSVKDCGDVNQRLFDMIINCGAHMFEEAGPIQKAHQITQLRPAPASEFYMAKARSVLKQIVREWSADGAAERSSCYDLVLKSVEEHFPCVEDRPDRHVLVTGAGLGRLAWECLQRNFSVTGNEFSIFMLLTSNFLLNTCQEVDEFTIFPYALDFSNSWSYADQLRAVKFPDVSPMFNAENRRNSFSMCAGDFLQAYGDVSERFDCVATVFFLDTAANPISYIRTIHRVLKTGGVWINFGPLTYHYEGDEDEDSLELPFDELIRIISQVGFRVDSVRGKNEVPPAKYTCNEDSMLQYKYNCGFFKCTKM